MHKGVKEYYFVKSVICIGADTGLLVFLIFFWNVASFFLNLLKKEKLIFFYEWLLRKNVTPFFLNKVTPTTSVKDFPQLK